MTDGSGFRAPSTAGGGGRGGGLGPRCWACPGVALAAPQAGMGPRDGAQAGLPDLRDAGAPPRGTATPAHTLGQRLSSSGGDRGQRDTPTAVPPTSIPGVGRHVQSPASCTCRSEFMNLLNSAFNSVQVQMTSN